MTPYRPPPPTSYRLPSMYGRAAVGMLLAVPYLLLYLGIPFAGLTYFESKGLPLPYPIDTLLGFGLALTALAVARYVTKPTRAFGPVSIVHAGVMLAYLLWLAANSTLTVSLAGGTFTLTYGMIFLAAAFAPLLGLAAALATTVEDAARPAERYPFDFPA